MNILGVTHIRRTFAALAIAVLCLLYADTAQAHRVNIFAWLEGDTIVTECGFRRNAPVKGGSVTVLDDTNGEELLRGTTDDGGRFSFPVPQAARNGHGLSIRINAGEGHQNEWHMAASEFTALLPAGAQTLPATPPAQAPARAEKPAEHRPLTREELNAALHEALERQLAPLRRTLAERSEEGPRLQDVIGGLGWIMGLVGMGLYFTRRRP